MSAALGAPARDRERAPLAPVRSSVAALETPGPLAPVKILWRHRRLVWQMTRKEIAGRYRGSLLGVAWSLVTPLLLLVLYTFVFGVVLEARWGERGLAGTEGFATLLFAGLLVFWLFSECLTRAPRLVVDHAAYARKMLFPVEVLPYVAMASGLFHFGVGLLVLLVAQLALFGGVPWTALLVPVVLLPLVVGVLGASWALASLGVFLRDIGHAIGIGVNAAMFLSPIFYPASVFPEGFRWVLTINPVAHTVVAVRQVLIFGEWPAAGPWLAYLGLSWALAWAGLAWFVRSRKALADVL